MKISLKVFVGLFVLKNSIGEISSRCKINTMITYFYFVKMGVDSKYIKKIFFYMLNVKKKQNFKLV